MASIRKRGELWQVQIRRKNAPYVSRSFRLKADAEAWARQMEVAADRRVLKCDPRALESISLEFLIRRYIDEITPRKRAGEFEATMLRAFLRHRLSKQNLVSLGPVEFAAYRDQRLKNCTGSTINREFAILHHLFEISRTEWGYPISENPVSLVRKPRNNPSRQRRLIEGEYEELLAAADQCLNRLIRPIIILAIETAMRRGEILSIRRGHIDFGASRLRIPITKTDVPRTIVLSPTAIEIMKQVCADRPSGDWKLFPMSSNAFRLCWDRLRRRANICDLHFHDLRHEAISRLFERGLNVAFVAAISGHKDFRMLAKYTHIDLDRLAPLTNGKKFEENDEIETLQ